jgi:rRNA maturation RNase YbeY
LNGDIYISTERVLDNAETYSVAFESELCRVMIHGVLHYMGYKDKSIEDKNEMRKKENTCLLLYKAN